MSLPFEYKYMSILFKIQGYVARDLQENGLAIDVELESLEKSKRPNADYQITATIPAFKGYT